MRTYLTFVTSDSSVIGSLEEMALPISINGRKRTVALYQMTILTVSTLTGGIPMSLGDSLIECS
jgi:hypothetical protein